MSSPQNPPPPPPTGMVLIHKPAGQTSFKTLGFYKRWFNTTRLGHTGTLDLFATGLMLALVGSATRLNRYLVLADKTYHATFCFGAETDTLDPEGRVVRTAPIPDLATIEAALPALRGCIQQIPPDYSAIHVAGKRAYERVLAGEKPALAAREVEVKRLELTGWDGTNLQVAVDCSKGTYIRSLARDLGLLCGSAAYVSALQRTKVGPYCLEDAHDPLSGLAPSLLTGAELLRGMAMASELVDPSRIDDILHGRPYHPANTTSPLALMDAEGSLLAIMEQQDQRWTYALVLGKVSKM